MARVTMKKNAAAVALGRAMTDAMREANPAKLIASRDVPSVDQLTGMRGVLRSEWRIISFDYSRQDHAEAVRWVGRGKQARIALEHRYIRRGTVEPWELVEVCETERDAFAYVSREAVAVYWPLVEWQREKESEREREASERERKAEETRRRDIAFRDKAASEAAFVRLYKGPEPGSGLARAWRAWIAAVTPAQTGAYKEDAEFMARYQAVMLSTKVPAKRVAIRRLLEYVGAPTTAPCEASAKTSADVKPYDH